ncbi:hypothetical protein N836_08735 [Leptolyngbya sp. Heron Island J]|uniref:hypothetical protein n=1 Tax=Leptolyngbya sp. Heron Island J TaxID=1385935 RepID=UPI0003B9EA2C|nr:hypothetical protein [Leptolyngbya sp. Heron Island J]ESA36056.1 hypothetical protein N836_08735 [Leptolyngbya sp. Heron Island J]
MLKSCYRLCRHHYTVLLLNLTVILPFALLTAYIKLSTVLNGYSGGRTLRRSTGIDLLITLFSEPYSIPYEGILTEISEIVWCFPIALCFFSASLLHHRQLRRYLMYFGTFLALLLIDDAFRITLILHFLLDIPKVLMYGLYSAAGVAIATYFWRTILTTPYGLLAIAGSLLTLSAAADFLPISGIGTPIMLEDGTKLLGLVNLTIYCWQSAKSAVVQSLPDTSTP